MSDPCSRRIRTTNPDGDREETSVEELSDELKDSMFEELSPDQLSDLKDSIIENMDPQDLGDLADGLDEAQEDNSEQGRIFNEVSRVVSTVTVGEDGASVDIERIEEVTFQDTSGHRMTLQFDNTQSGEG